MKVNPFGECFPLISCIRSLLLHKRWIITMVLFRTCLLKDVYSFLADLIDWSDQILLSDDHLSRRSVHVDERYKSIAQDLTQSIRV